MRSKKVKPWSNAEALNRLDRYAEELLDQSTPVSKPNAEIVKIKKPKNNEQMSRRLKKKNNKLKKLEAAAALTNELPSFEKNQPKRKSHREQIIEQLNLPVQNNVKITLNKDEEVKPVASPLKHTIMIEPKVFQFQDLSKKKPRVVAQVSESEDENDDYKQTPAPKNLNFAKARYEILRFGISGFQKKEKEEANVALAIKLGAKAPKRKYVNYKEMMENQQKEKQRRKEENIKNRKPKLNAKKPRNVNKVSGFDGQIGKYINGVQKISIKDIKSVASKKRK